MLRKTKRKICFKKFVNIMHIKMKRNNGIKRTEI